MREDYGSVLCILRYYRREGEGEGARAFRNFSFSLFIAFSFFFFRFLFYLFILFLLARSSVESVVHIFIWASLVMALLFETTVLFLYPQLSWIVFFFFLAAR